MTRPIEDLEKYGPNIYELLHDELGFDTITNYPDDALRWALIELSLRRKAEGMVEFWRDSCSVALTARSLAEKREKKLQRRLKRLISGREGERWWWTFRLLKIRARLAWYVQQLRFHRWRSDEVYAIRSEKLRLGTELYESNAKVEALTKCLDGKHEYRGKVAIPGFEGVEVIGLTFGGEAVAVKRYCQHCYQSEEKNDQNGGDMGGAGRGEVSGDSDGQGGAAG